MIFQQGLIIDSPMVCNFTTTVGMGDRWLATINLRFRSSIDQRRETTATAQVATARGPARGPARGGARGRARATAGLGARAALSTNSSHAAEATHATDDPAKAHASHASHASYTTTTSRSSQVSASASLPFMAEMVEWPNPSEGFNVRLYSSTHDHDPAQAYRHVPGVIVSYSVSYSYAPAFLANSLSRLLAPSLSCSL